MKTIKKSICLLLSLFILLTITPTKASAAVSLSHTNVLSDTNTEIIYQDDEIIIECTLTIFESSPDTRLFSTRSAKKNKTNIASKTVSIKSSTGSVIANYILTGTFSYNGSSSSCTKATYSSSIKNSNWSFTSKKASASGNKANGSYKLKNSSTGKTKSGSVSITCSKSGVIS